MTTDPEILPGNVLLRIEDTEIIPDRPKHMFSEQRTLFITSPVEYTFTTKSTQPKVELSEIGVYGRSTPGERSITDLKHFARVGKGGGDIKLFAHCRELGKVVLGLFLLC